MSGRRGVASVRWRWRSCWVLVAWFRRARQAVNVHPCGAGLAQQTGDALGGGAGGEYVVDYGQMQAFDLAICCQLKGLAQIASALGGTQLLPKDAMLAEATRRYRKARNAPR